MSDTFSDLFTHGTWPWPGESSSSDEAGLTPAPIVNTPLSLYVHRLSPQCTYPFFDTKENCLLLLSNLRKYRRLINPSELLLYQDRHLFLVWHTAGCDSIFIQLLIAEQVWAMQNGLIPPHPASTWTGDCWLDHTDYLALGRPGSKFTATQCNDYQNTLRLAAHELCKCLHLNFIPWELAIHRWHMQNLDCGKGAEQTELMSDLRREHKRKAVADRKKRNKDRKLAQTRGMDPCIYAKGWPLNMSRQQTLENSQLLASSSIPSDLLPEQRQTYQPMLNMVVHCEPRRVSEPGSGMSSGTTVHAPDPSSTALSHLPSKFPLVKRQACHQPPSTVHRSTLFSISEPGSGTPSKTTVSAADIGSAGRTKLSTTLANATTHDSSVTAPSGRRFHVATPLTSEPGSETSDNCARSPDGPLPPTLVHSVRQSLTVVPHSTLSSISELGSGTPRGSAVDVLDLDSPGTTKLHHPASLPTARLMHQPSKVASHSTPTGISELGSGTPGGVNVDGLERLTPGSLLVSLPSAESHMDRQLSLHALRTATSISEPGSGTQSESTRCASDFWTALDHTTWVPLPAEQPVPQPLAVMRRSALSNVSELGSGTLRESTVDAPDLRLLAKKAYMKRQHSRASNQLRSEHQPSNHMRDTQLKHRRLATDLDKANQQWPPGSDQLAPRSQQSVTDRRRQLRAEALRKRYLGSKAGSADTVEKPPDYSASVPGGYGIPTSPTSSTHLQPDESVLITPQISVVDQLDGDAEDVADYETDTDIGGQQSTHLLSALPDFTADLVVPTASPADSDLEPPIQAHSLISAPLVNRRNSRGNDTAMIPDLVPESTWDSAASCRFEKGHCKHPRNEWPPEDVSSFPAAPPPAIPANHPNHKNRLGVDLADQVDLPYLEDGTWALSIRGFDHTPHELTLRVSSCQMELIQEADTMHFQHCAHLDLAVRKDTMNAPYFERTLDSHACTSDVLVSLSDAEDIVSFCLLQSVGKVQQTRASPTWTVTLIYTRPDYRGKGFASALLMCATQRAVRVSPWLVTSRTHSNLASILAGAGFEQCNQGSKWVYRHSILQQSTPRVEMSRVHPQGFGSTRRLCAVHCCLQLLCGQPGLATKITNSTWPMLRCGHSIAMLLGFDRTTGYFHGTNASASTLLDRLYTRLARRNKCIQGRSSCSQEDQDARELFLALLISLDRERPPGEPLDTCRLKVHTRMTCASSPCSNQLERTDPDRVIKLLVPPNRHDQLPFHLEAVLQGYTEPRAVEHKCGTCGANFHIHQSSIHEASQDVFVWLDRLQHPATGIVDDAAVSIPTILSLEVRGRRRPLHLRSVLIHTRIRGSRRGETTPHWIVVTSRVLQEKLTWFLVSDETVVELGDLGHHAPNVTLALSHERLRDYSDAKVYGAFYAEVDPSLLPLPSAIRPAEEYSTRLLWNALTQLTAAGATVEPCHVITYASPQSLQREVTSILSLGSPAGLRGVPYPRTHLTEVDMRLRQSLVRLAVSGGSLSKPGIPTSFLTPRAVAKGNAEAVDGGLQSPTFEGHGRSLAKALGDQLGTTLLDPAGVVVTTASFVTPFHYHCLPVINMFISTYSDLVWRAAGLFDSALTKSYIFTSADVLDSMGIKARGSIDLSSMLTLISRLSKAEREVIKFQFLVMDSRDITHVVFPPRWYHWVATEPNFYSKTLDSLYCGVGAYMFPNDLAEARRLQQSLREHATCPHTAKQPLTPAESGDLLVRHIEALETAPCDTPTPMSQLRGTPDSTVLHA